MRKRLAVFSWHGERFYACEPNDIFISSITAAALAYGVENSAHVEANRHNLGDFLALVQVLPWHEKAMWHYAKHKIRLWCIFWSNVNTLSGRT